MRYKWVGLALAMLLAFAPMGSAQSPEDWENYRISFEDAQQLCESTKACLTLHLDSQVSFDRTSWAYDRDHDRYTVRAKAGFELDGVYGDHSIEAVFLRNEIGRAHV